MTLSVHVITPNGTIWDGLAQLVILPSPTGELGILSGHAALATLLDIGVLRILFNQQWLSFFLLNGFAQVEGDVVTVLVAGAEQGNHIDLQLAEIALEAAQCQRDQASDNREKQRAAQAIKQAQARLQAAQINVAQRNSITWPNS